VGIARANLIQAQAKDRGLAGLARSEWYELAHAVEGLNNQVADLHASVDALRAANATLTIDSHRQTLHASGSGSNLFHGQRGAIPSRADCGPTGFVSSIRRVAATNAEIDGVVTRRNVNPGDQVRAGQGLMAVRSLTEIWVDANFKETQLRELRIGQPILLMRRSVAEKGAHIGAE
jgi:multidrug resistance efflux pump